MDARVRRLGVWNLGFKGLGFGPSLGVKGISRLGSRVQVGVWELRGFGDWGLGIQEVLS